MAVSWNCVSGICRKLGKVPMSCEEVSWLIFILAWLLALWRAGLQMVINDAPSLAPVLLLGKLMLTVYFEKL